MIAQLSPTEIGPIIDKAASASDRWLFVALLVIGIFALWMVVKYLTGRIDKADGKVDEMSKFQRDTLANLVTASTGALERNTEALKHNTVALERVKNHPYTVNPSA